MYSKYKNTTVLSNEVKAIELTVNDNKTKITELLPNNNQDNNVLIQGNTFKKVKNLLISVQLYVVKVTSYRNERPHCQDSEVVLCLN